MAAEETAAKRSVRLLILLHKDEAEAVDDWRFRNRMPSRAAAVRELLRLGLNGLCHDPPEAIAATGSFAIAREA